MKKFVLTLSIIFLFSCEKKQENLISVNITSYVKKNMNNPKSFEFVKLYTSDTIFESDILKNKIDSVSQLSLLLEEIPITTTDQYLIKNNKEQKKIIDERLKYYNSLKKQLKDIKEDKILFFNINYSFRETNENNAIVKRDYSFLVDEKYNLIEPRNIKY